MYQINTLRAHVREAQSWHCTQSHNLIHFSEMNYWQSTILVITNPNVFGELIYAITVLIVLHGTSEMSSKNYDKIKNILYVRWLHWEGSHEYFVRKKTLPQVVFKSKKASTFYRNKIIFCLLTMVYPSMLSAIWRTKLVFSYHHHHMLRWYCKE